MATNNKRVNPMELELENFVEEDEEVSNVDQTKSCCFNHPIAFLQTLMALIVAYMSYYRRITVPLAVVGIILAVVVSLEYVVASFTQKKHIAIVQKDYIQTRSWVELKMLNIDHWCLSGGDDDCSCVDPTMALPNEQTKGWVKAHNQNKMLVKNVNNLNTVFLGDQFMEQWNAQVHGAPTNEYKAVKSYFEQTFNPPKGDIHGVSLGIAGDMISNLMWRLRHGELPTSEDVEVFWILIGNNDLSIGQCSEEAVVLGILRIAEFLAEKFDSAAIVINSLLPSLKTVKPRNKQIHFKEFDLLPSILAVNMQLEKFCQKNKKFKFFDASPLFFESALPSLKDLLKKKKRIPKLKTKLISEDGELTVLGHEMWGDKISEELSKLVDITVDDNYDDQPNEEDDMYQTVDDFMV